MSARLKLVKQKMTNVNELCDAYIIYLEYETVGAVIIGNEFTDEQALVEAKKIYEKTKSNYKQEIILEEII